MNPRLQLVMHQVERTLQQHPRISSGVAAGAVAIGVGTWLYVRLRRLSPEEIERRRRDHLATIGRITDGHIVDARTFSGDDSLSETPEVLVYSYRLAGVTYDCAQDVSALPELVRGYRLDQQVSVRYDPRNPGNSILVAENWSGLWLTQKRPSRHK